MAAVPDKLFEPLVDAKIREKLRATCTPGLRKSAGERKQGPLVVKHPDHVHRQDEIPLKKNPPSLLPVLDNSSLTQSPSKTRSPSFSKHLIKQPNVPILNSSSCLDRTVSYSKSTSKCFTNLQPGSLTFSPFPCSSGQLPLKTSLPNSPELPQNSQTFFNRQTSEHKPVSNLKPRSSVPQLSRPPSPHSCEQLISRNSCPSSPTLSQNSHKVSSRPGSLLKPASSQTASLQHGSLPVSRPSSPSFSGQVSSKSSRPSSPNLPQHFHSSLHKQDITHKEVSDFQPISSVSVLTQSSLSFEQVSSRNSRPNSPILYQNCQNYTSRPDTLSKADGIHVSNLRPRSPVSRLSRPSSPVSRLSRPPSPCSSDQVLSRNSRPSSPNPYRNRQNSPSGPSSRHPSSSGFIEPKVRSPSGTGDHTLVGSIWKRISKAKRARLYLLNQPGPHSFLVAGDSPEHKYKVIIGPQSCSCGRGPHCIHILFIMLRVFQVNEADSRLFSRSLKNFEVNELVRQYHLRKERQVQVASPINQHISTPVSRPVNKLSRSESSLPDAAIQEQQKMSEESTLCPICLLDMVEGESLVRCEQGCHNRLHHHCIAIWAEECRQQNEPILCPLCRSQWSLPSRLETEKVVAKNSQQSPSEHHVTIPARPHHLPLMRPYLATSISLPKTESLSHAQQQQAQPWMQVFEKDLINCLFSRNWTVRETALCRLARKVTSNLSLNQENSESGKENLITKQSCSRRIIEICCSIMATMVSDPVYKVYIACLRCLRALLACCPCKAEECVLHLQEQVQPIVRTILLKCADGNRRTCQLSIAALLELAHGQAGALAVGTHTSYPAHTGLGGVGFVLKCILEKTKADEEHSVPSWQWLLGRLVVAKRLMEEFPQEFYLLYAKTDDINGANTRKLVNYERLIGLVELAVKALDHSHTTVNKLAQRVFLLASSFCVHVEPVFCHVYDMLSGLNISLHNHLTRKLQNIAEQNHIPPWNDFEKDKVNRARTPSEFISGRSSFDNCFNIGTQKRYERYLLAEKLVSESKCDIFATSKDTKSRYGFRSAPSSPSHIQNNKLFLRFKPLKMVKGNCKIKDLSQSHVLGTPISVPNIPCKVGGRNCSTSLIKPDRTILSEFVPSVCFQEETNCTVGELIDLSVPLVSGSTPSCSYPPISFHSEIGTPLSPTAAPSQVTDSTPERMAETKEPSNQSKEDVTFKKTTMSVVSRIGTESQSSLPLIPGLREFAEEDIIIKLQPNEDQRDNNANVGTYLEQIHWRKGHLLGTGSFSSCYQARDLRTGTLMAVKQVSFCRNSDEEQEKVMDAISEEIVLMAKLDHPNVLRILGATQQSGHYNVFIEWMAGGSVESLLGTYGPFSEQVIVRYTRQVLAGLTYLHDNQIIHRDLKGANLLVDSTGHHLRIADFGAAAKLVSHTTVAGEFKGQLLGTVAFMAPEVLRGENYGRSCDIWSVGCVMIEMGTTKPPWNADGVFNQLALIFKIGSSTSPPPIPDYFSPVTQDLAFRCLEIISEKRPTAKKLLHHPCFHLFPT
ncbi:mitogen-activated protein kinase kinase kinase 1-like [Limulus polyphemus]|uniref:Mitogen-activated protein kinase kinase kinase 1-like n=1 Tax=Limulus polyphemus TaxID=6850 RepID=A0ABM1B6K0_LIMPO|nr:mitogen-activated protein kinase kinase kinase 1-like [Limulus polyphemus]XP_022243126.1 mitogen-activated protein kinase kinase kinase 1-like [Limulus polyphemus]